VKVRFKKKGDVKEKDFQTLMLKSQTVGEKGKRIRLA